MKHPTFLFCTLFILSVALNAAEPSEVTELPKVTSWATSPSLTAPDTQTVRDEIQQTPGGVSVLDAETYKTGRATTVKDALDYVLGVFVQPRFGAEESRISIRGSGIQRTFHGRGLKFLQDGVPLNLADGGFDFQAVEPLATKHIEVYRGANALEFGGTTLGGAVNFVAPTGYDAPPASIRFEYGSFETYRAQLAAAGVHGMFDYYVSLSHFSQDGFREHSQQNNQRLFANLGFRLNDKLETRFYVTAAQTDSELPGSLTKAQLETTPDAAQRNAFTKMFDYVDSNWKRDFALFRLANKTTWKDGDHRVIFSSFWSAKDLDHPILFVIDQRSHDFGLGLRYDYTGEIAGHTNRFTAGVSPTWGVLEDNRFANDLGNRGAKFADATQRATNLDFYLEDQFWLAEQVAISLGGQVSYAVRKSRDDFPGGPDNSDRQDWWGYSPKIGLLFQPQKDLQFFTNLSRSFEPPSFGELANAANGGEGLVKLDAQTATTFEIGTRGAIGGIKWDAAYYYSWVDHELLEYQVAPGLTQTVNAEGTTHQGIELGVEATLWNGIFVHDETALSKDGKTAGGCGCELDFLSLRVAGLWNDFRYDGDATYGDGLIAGLPEYYLRAELLYQHPSGFYIGPNVEVVPKGYRVDARGTLFAGGYTLLGAKVGWRNQRGFSCYVEVKNLTDEQYASTTGVVSEISAFNTAQFFPGDGRGIYAGIEYRW